MSFAERLFKLFSGFDGAHGTHGEPVGDEQKVGKLIIRATARTPSVPPDVELWEKHIRGSRPLGIIPLRRDFTCKFAAIDVDDYSVSHVEVIARVKREGYPLIACRSKSGGIHLYGFFKDPIPAKKVRSVFAEMAKKLGFPGVEVFPKQDHADWDADSHNKASWINMPYLGGDETDRYAMSEQANGLTLEQFLDKAEAAQMDEAKLDSFFTTTSTKANRDTTWNDAPPCLVTLMTNGVSESRNDAMMSYIVFAKKKFGEDWEKKVREWNQKHFTPPLSDESIDSVIQSNKSKTYNYRCTLAPINAVCNSSLCRTRRYGVNTGTATMPDMTELSVLDTDEPEWTVKINDDYVKLTTDQLVNYDQFQKRMVEACHLAMPVVKKDTWMAILAGLLADVNVVEAPDDVSRQDQFMEVLGMHCMDRHRADVREEITMGKAWHDTELSRIWFRMQDIQSMCDRMRFKFYTRTQMSRIFRELGGDRGFHKLRGVGVSCWWIPIDTFDQQTEPHVVPKLGDEVL